MERPEGCPLDVYNLMLKCWEWKVAERPSFKDILEEMNTMFTNTSISEEVEKSRREPPQLPAKKRNSRKDTSSSSGMVEEKNRGQEIAFRPDERGRDGKESHRGTDLHAQSIPEHGRFE